MTATLSNVALAIALQALWQRHVVVSFSSAAQERLARERFARSRQVQDILMTKEASRPT